MNPAPASNDATFQRMMAAIQAVVESDEDLRGAVNQLLGDGS